LLIVISLAAEAKNNARDSSENSLRNALLRSTEIMRTSLGGKVAQFVIRNNFIKSGLAQKMENLMRTRTCWRHISIMSFCKHHTLHTHWRTYKLRNGHKWILVNVLQPETDCLVRGGRPVRDQEPYVLLCYRKEPHHTNGHTW